MSLKFVAILLMFISLSSGWATMAQSETCDWDSIVAGSGDFETLATYEVFSDTGAAQVILIEERHDLISAQVESAVMIHRLASECGMTVLGLEGEFPGTDFRSATADLLQMPFEPLVYTMADMLGDGEINQAEFAMVVYPALSLQDSFTLVDLSLEVEGIDDEAYYNQPTPDEEFGTYSVGMLYTALPLLEDDDFNTAIGLLNNSPEDPGLDAPQEEQEAYLEALDAWRTELFDLVYGANPEARIRDWHSASESDEIIPIEREIENMDLAISVMEDYQSDTQSFWDLDMSEYIAAAGTVRSFFVAAQERSVTMVDVIGNRMQTLPIMASVIGAAHTEWMVQALVEDGFDVVVLTPISFIDEERAVVLTNDEYTAKLNQQSIDAPGELGALLQGGKKPQIVIDEPVIQTKSQLQILAYIATRDFAASPDASLEAIFADVPLLDGVAVIPDSLQVTPSPNGDIYTFEVTINIAGVGVDRLYIGVAPALWNDTELQTIVDPVLDIERILLAEYTQLQRTDAADDSALSGAEAAAGTTLFDIGGGVQAAAGQSAEAVQTRIGAG